MQDKYLQSYLHQITYSHQHLSLPTIVPNTVVQQYSFQEDQKDCFLSIYSTSREFELLTSIHEKGFASQKYW
jgi:hypothetical protein